MSFSTSRIIVPSLGYEWFQKHSVIVLRSIWETSSLGSNHYLYFLHHMYLGNGARDIVVISLDSSRFPTVWMGFFVGTSVDYHQFECELYSSILWFLTDQSQWTIHSPYPYVCSRKWTRFCPTTIGRCCCVWFTSWSILWTSGCSYCCMGFASRCSCTMGYQRRFPLLQHPVHTQPYHPHQSSFHHGPSRYGT